jgi:hypothetical protein
LPALNYLTIYIFILIGVFDRFLISASYPFVRSNIAIYTEESYRKLKRKGNRNEKRYQQQQQQQQQQHHQ